MPATSWPNATYRLQFNAAFTFTDARAIVGYLDKLGVSHVYASNYFTAVPGSTHGYDVADPTEINPEIGDEVSHAKWVASLRSHGMGHIVDLVPNHMGIARSANPWWQDVLENGESSRFAQVFDIDWHPLKPELEHKVLLAVLGDVYGTVLERREIALEYHNGAFAARYYEHLFPIAPGTYDRILRHRLDDVLAAVGPDSDDGVELLSILTAIGHLPHRDTREPELRVERHREKEVIKRRLAALTERSTCVREHVQCALAHFNGVCGDAHSFDALDELLNAQPYRLASWRVAAEEINYRRFFDVNELAAIRVEDPAVFDLTHQLAFDLLAQGMVDGFRIDHVDGLFDPGSYLARVQARARELRPDRYSADTPLYLAVEKILMRNETLPAWPVAGTTGYDFLTRINGLFVDSRNEGAMDDVYERFTRIRAPYRETVYRGKQLILRISMASELNALAHQLNRFSERHRHYRDFTLNSLAQAMREIIACFPVYRTYVSERDATVSDRDRAYIEQAVREATRLNPNRPAVVYNFVRDLLLRKADNITPDTRDEHLVFVGKFQQVTSPVTAKGIEDTAFYIYNRLVSLNEVGGEPDEFGIEPHRVHAWLVERAERWGGSLSSTSTHDTKRSEDVRARLDVLSEMPGAWKQFTSRWGRLNQRARTTIDGHSYPSRNEEFLLYQTLLGSWPLTTMDASEERAYCERIVAYMHKAMREAKVFTSWINPSEPHEQAMKRFVEGVLAPDHAAFREDFQELHRRVAHYGIYNSLAQLAIKIGAPGVPDFYQGAELWNFTLVDPDNRRPVDYQRRHALIAELDARCTREGRAAVAAALLDSASDDRLKLYTTMGGLRYRRQRPELFRQGAYRPIETSGAQRDHVFAFTRGGNDPRHVVVAVPRLIATLAPDIGIAPLGERVWGDTRLMLPGLAPRGYRHIFTDRSVPVMHDAPGAGIKAADLFQDFPVALLEAQ